MAIKYWDPTRKPYKDAELSEDVVSRLQNSHLAISFDHSGKEFLKFAQSELSRAYAWAVVEPAVRKQYQAERKATSGEGDDDQDADRDMLLHNSGQLVVSFGMGDFGTLGV